VVMEELEALAGEHRGLYVCETCGISDVNSCRVITACLWLHDINLSKSAYYAVLQRVHAASTRYWECCKGSHGGAAGSLSQLFECLLLCLQVMWS
jgi:hypothetical protein